MQGIVKWYNDGKGYGFLEVDGRACFVHYTAIQGDGFKTLVEGETVKCTIVNGPKGLQAVTVTRLGGL
jgi:CspA family cold shock protein